MAIEKCRIFTCILLVYFINSVRLLTFSMAPFSSLKSSMAGEMAASILFLLLTSICSPDIFAKFTVPFNRSSEARTKLQITMQLIIMLGQKEERLF